MSTDRSAASSSGSAVYAERLWAPWSMVVVTTVLTASFGVAVGYPIGTVAGIAAFVVAEGIACWVLLRASGRIEVGDGLLRAGRAQLPLTAVGAVSALDRTQAALLRGREADARAYLFLRSWAPLAVRVDVDDPTDPTPYWYISTRHPRELAAALTGPR